jgi:hypothetical protein
LLQGPEADPIVLNTSLPDPDNSVISLQAIPLSRLAAHPDWTRSRLVGLWTLTLAELPVIPAHLFSLNQGDGPIPAGTPQQGHSPQGGTAELVGEFTAKAIRDLGGFLVDWQIAGFGWSWSLGSLPDLILPTSTPVDAPEQARHRFCLWETKGGPWYGKLKESRLHTQGVLPEYLSNRTFQKAMHQTEQLGWRILQTLTWTIPPAGRPATRYWEDQHRSTRLYLDNNLPGAVATELMAPHQDATWLTLIQASSFQGLSFLRPHRVVPPIQGHPGRMLVLPGYVLADRWRVFGSEDIPADWGTAPPEEHLVLLSGPQSRSARRGYRRRTAGPGDTVGRQPGGSSPELYVPRLRSGPRSK